MVAERTQYTVQTKHNLRKLQFDRTYGATLTTQPSTQTCFTDAAVLNKIWTHYLLLQ